MRKVKVVLDTSFLLPILGVEVKEVSRDDLAFLKEISSKVSLLYPSPMLIELTGKVLKKAREQGLNSLPVEAIKGLGAILSGTFIEIINPDVQAFTLASQMWLNGHRDFLDNIAYACSITLDAYFLTLDSELVSFLRKRKYRVDNVVDMAKLRKILS